MQGFRQKIGMLVVAGVMTFGIAGCETGIEEGMIEGESPQAAAARAARSAAAAQAAAERAEAAAARAERIFQQSMQK